jgi:hypothetical protein
MVVVIIKGADYCFYEIINATVIVFEINECVVVAEQHA